MKFEEGIKYPFVRSKGLTNIFWALIPIFGWLALGGYKVDIVTSIVSGKKEKGLPTFRGFGTSMAEGFMLILRMLPIMILLIILTSFIGMLSENLGVLIYLIFSIIYIPMMTINVMVKKKISATFEFKHILNLVSKNFGEYLITLLRGIGYSLVTTLLMLVLVGIPMTMARNMYWADFYRENSGNK